MDKGGTPGSEAGLGCRSRHRDESTVEFADTEDVEHDDDGCFADEEGDAGAPVRCPPLCSCTPTHVACPGVGLLVIPSSTECPPDTVTIDRYKTQMVINSAERIIGRPLPPLDLIYNTRLHSRAMKIAGDHSHQAIASSDGSNRQSLREQLPGPSSVAGSVEIEEAASTDCIEAEDGVAVGFDFALVPPFVRSVREAIEWEEEEEPPAKKRYFPHLKKKPISFPVMDEVNELILDEWSKTDKKAPLLNRMTKLYPLEGNLIPQLETPPTVDAAVMRLAKHVTLPLEDSVSFKDPLDRKMDSELRRAHINIGAVCKPAIALTSVSRAIRAWADNMEGAIQGDVDRKTLLSALEEFRLASDFVGEAAFDIIRSAARGNKEDLGQPTEDNSNTGQEIIDLRETISPFESLGNLHNPHYQNLISNEPQEVQRNPLNPSEMTPAQLEPVGGRLQEYYLLWAENIRDQWVLDTIRRGHTWMFKSDPPQRIFIRTEIPKSDQRRDILTQYVSELFQKRAIVRVKEEEKYSGLYSPLFFVAKKSGELRPVLDLRLLNLHIRQDCFKMETLQSIIPSIQLGDWLISVDLSDAYLHIPIHTRYQKYLRFAVGEEHFQFRVLPFGICTAPRTFSKVLVTLIALLRQRGLQVHHYLDDILLIAQSKQKLLEHKETLLHTLQQFGWLINWDKSKLTPAQTLIFLGAEIDTVHNAVRLPQEKVQTILRRVNSVKIMDSLSARQCLALLGTLTATIPMVKWAKWNIREFQTGFLHQWQGENYFQRIQMVPTMIHQLKWWTNVANLRNHHNIIPPRPMLITTDASQWGWGAHMDKRVAQGVWTTHTQNVPANIIELRAAYEALRFFHREIRGANVILRMDNTTAVAYVQNQGESVSRCFESQKHRPQGMDAKARNIPTDMLQMGTPINRPDGNRLEHKVPVISVQAQVPTSCRLGCINSSMDVQTKLCVPTNTTDTSVTEENTEGESGSTRRDTILAQETLVLSLTDISHCTSHEVTMPTRHALSGRNTASLPKDSEFDGMETERSKLISLGCSPTVIDTLLRARKNSTNLSYHRTWRRFLEFIEERQLNIASIQVNSVLDFLQRGLELGLALRTIKGQISALSALTSIRWAVHPLVVQFVQAVTKIKPPIKKWYPQWDLPLVLQGLSSEPFVPLSECNLQNLTLKTVFLTAITSARRVSELQALSCEAPFTEFFPDRVTLRPMQGFIPKVATSFHFNQEWSLPQFLNPDSDRPEDLSIPEILREYIMRTSEIRKSKRLFVIPDGHRKGQAATVRTIANWDLSGNQLTVFRTRVLSEHRNIRELNLSHNQISIIEEVGVTSLPQLQILSTTKQLPGTEDAIPNMAAEPSSPQPEQLHTMQASEQCLAPTQTPEDESRQSDTGGSGRGDINYQTLAAAVVEKLAPELQAVIQAAIDHTLKDVGLRLQLHDHRLDQAEARIQQIEDDRAKEVKGDKQLRAEHKQMQEKLQDLENRSRRNNLRVVGLPETMTAQALRDFCASTLPKMLGFKRGCKVERAHRVGPPRQASDKRPPRLVLARYLDFAEKNEMLRAYRELDHPLEHQNTQIRIFNDYSAELVKGGRVVMDQEGERCRDSSLSLLPCAEQFVSCVRSPLDHVLSYSLITPVPHSSSSCLALCFRHGYSYYGMDNVQQCLCGSLTSEDGDPCKGVCSRDGTLSGCSKSIIQDFQPIQVTVSLSGPAYQAMFQPVRLRVVASIPVAQFIWEFQDGSQPVVTAGGVTCHRYSVPGRYRLKVRAEGQEPGAQATVTVAVSVDVVELHCPAVAQTGQSVEVWLKANHGTDLRAVYGVQLPDGQCLTDDSSCPRGGRVFRDHLRCYWLNQVREPLSEARSRCTSIPGGDLVYITSTDQLSFIQESFKSHSSVWVNMSQSLKDVSSRPSAVLNTGGPIIQDCVRLSLIPGEMYSRSSCLDRAPSICESRAGVNLPDAPVYLVGVPVFDDVTTENATLHFPPERPQRDVEVMVFPGLWFSHAGSLLAMDFGVQPLHRELLVRIQILRPFCSPEQHLLPPGCVVLWSPYATCHPQPHCNTTGDCPSGKQWCPLSETCLSLNQPCSTYGSKHYAHPPRYRGIPPSYSPIADIPLHLSPDSKKRNIQVQLSHLSHSVYPEDVISIQHTGDKGSFMRCASSLDSPWRQTYASMTNQGWLEDTFVLDFATWVDNVVCDLQVLYGSELQSLVVSPLLGGFQEEGTYSLSAVVSNGISSAAASCDVTVLSPVSELQVIYPALGPDSLHVVTQDPKLVVLSARSSSPARVQWSMMEQSGEALLQPTCPSNLSSSLMICTATPADVGFAWMWLHFDQPQVSTFTMVVSNEVSAVNLSVPIHSHDAIQELRIHSNGPDHIILNQTRVFTAELAHGSSVVFTWIMDDNEGFSYKGTRYMVTFRTPGVYRMRLVAQNPISFQETEMLLQVEGTLPPPKAELLSSSTLVLVSETQTLTLRMQVARSSNVTIRWDFGDGSPVLNRTFSAPNENTQNNKDFLVTFNATESHMYDKEGHHQITVSLYNNGFKITQSLQTQVVHQLSSLILKVDRSTFEVHKKTMFHVICLPSPFGVMVTWNFGDESETLQSKEIQMQHVYNSPRTYNVTATASNGRSTVTKSMMVTIEERIEGLQVVSNGPTELGAKTQINCSLTQGTDVIWDIHMGDGISYLNHSESSVIHIYTQSGNFTVTALARNSLSSINGSIIVEIVRIHVMDVLPEVVASHANTMLIARLTIPPTLFSFSWDFGDGTPVVIVQGKAEVWHSYVVPGKHTLKLWVGGQTASNTINKVITVEDQISAATISASASAVNVSQMIHFHASVHPPPDPAHHYWYEWDFNLGTLPLNNSSPDVSWAYDSEGNYSITMTVGNQVSQYRAQSYVIVQQSVTSVSIECDGGDVIPGGTAVLFRAIISPNVSADFLWDFGDFSFAGFGQNVSHTFYLSGNVTIRVLAKNNVSHHQASVTLYVQDLIKMLDLHADHVLAKTTQRVNFFTSLSSGNRVEYLWSMCRSCPFLSGPSNVSHIFSDPGDYQVSVKAQNVVSSAEASVMVEVQEPLEGVIISQENPEVAGYADLTELLTLTAHVVKGSNLTFRWVLWPGPRKSSNSSISLYPTQLGELSAEVWVENALGAGYAHIQLKILDRVKGASIRTPTSFVTVGTSVNATIFVESGSELQYYWNFDEGSIIVNHQNQSVTFKFLTPGLKTIRVTVSNALGATTASMKITVQEVVSNLSIGIEGVYNSQAVLTNKSILFWGSVVQGTDMRWKWTVSELDEVFTYTTQNASHIFRKPGQYWLNLQAWNLVANATTSRLLLVQDAISGFIVNTEKNIFCLGQEVNFCPSVYQGTNVTFTLIIPELNLSQNISGKCGHFYFPSSGVFKVFAIAYNLVSRARFNHSIQILESENGLMVKGVPSAYPVNQTLQLTASLESEDSTRFQWTFQQADQPEYTITGQMVEFTCLKTGTLHVLLNVSNPSCSYLWTSSITIQSPVTKVLLHSSRKEVFLNECVTFLAVTSDGSDLHFHWTIEGNGKNITNLDNLFEYCYNQEGNFVTQVTAFNFVSRVSAQSTVTVRALQCAQPNVEFQEPPVFLYRAFGGNFEISADLKACTKYRAVHRWQIYKGTNCFDDLLVLPKLDTFKTLLTIPGRTLYIGFYCLLFSITFEGTPLSNNVTHIFEVRHSPLVANIHGGSRRTWSVDTDFTLDGTESFDPDIEDGQNDTGIQFEWHVELLEKEEGNTCLLPSLLGLPRISIIWPEFCANKSFIVTLTVRKPGRESTAAQQIVSLHAGPVLPVYIRCISCHLSASSPISQRSPVILYGECDSCPSETLFTWSSVDSVGRPLSLGNHTTSSGPRSQRLVIQRGALQDSLSYTFILRVTQQGGREWGENSLNLTMNKPPTGGTCSLLPPSNILWLETPLEYNCTGWWDPDSDTQVFYSLSVGICSAGGCHKLHLYHGLKSRQSVLPPMDQEVGEIHVYLEVEDLHGSRTLAVNRTLSISVPLLPHGISRMQWLRNRTEPVLQQMAVVSDTALVIQRALRMVTALTLGENRTEEEQKFSKQVTNHVTQTVSSIQVSSLWEVAAVSATLRQCVLAHDEVDGPVWWLVLNAAEKMIHVLAEEGNWRQRPPDPDIPENMLTVLGGALTYSYSEDLNLAAFNLMRALIISLGKSRAMDEEPLVLKVPGIRTQVTPLLSGCLLPTCGCPAFKFPKLLHNVAGHQGLLQVVIELEENPFPGGLPPNLTLSSQLVALEFLSFSGNPVLVEDLPESSAIQLTLPVKKEIALNPTSAFIPPRGTANLTLSASMPHRPAGMHLHLSITLMDGSERSLDESAGVEISYGLMNVPNNSDEHRVHMLNISPGLENTHNVTLLLPSSWSGSLLEVQVNVTSLLSITSVTLSACLFSSVCQYFHVPSLTWKTDGMSPSNASKPGQAACRAQHLTLFGASLFVPPHRLLWLPPAPRHWTLALMCCSVLLTLYLLLVLITHKMDHLDISRVGTIPLCGPKGQYRYWVLVKTGWKRGAGTTAHVGICLYGLNKSGARHLDSRGGLTTGSMDMFQVETDSNLGEVWKIRIWHDNTGLDPAWFLQYVAVWDKQTDFLYFFLVNDWLSVENERNGGRVEKEILATCPQELLSFSQVFPQQLFLGWTDWHLWLSVWWRPARSRFTHVQRVTCCSLVLHLYMTICALWYGAIGVKGESSPLGLQPLVTWESILIGVLVSLMALPVQILFSFLFRETRSLVFAEDATPTTQTTEQEGRLDTSSPLSLPRKADSLLDISSLSCASASSSKFTFDLEKDGGWFAERPAPIWMSSCESLYDTRCNVGSESGFGFTQALCKEKEKAQLGFLSACSSGEDPLSLSEGSSSSPHFTLSEENLLQSTATEAQVWKWCEESDSGRYSPRPDLGSPSPESGDSLMSYNEDCYVTGCWSESQQWIEAKRTSFSFSSCVSEGTGNDSELQECWDIPSASPSPFTTRIGVQWKPQGWLFPPRTLWAIYTMALLLLTGCVTITVSYTASLSEHGFFMWLISCTCALLSSALLLEPLRVVLLSLYNALYRPPVLSEGMGLVEEPLIKKITDHSDKVRAPGGFSLLQAKEEARRVRALRSMTQSCTGYMVFFLLVLLMNFQISFHDYNIRLLHMAIKQSLTGTPTAGDYSVHSSELRAWLSSTLPAHLYSDQSLVLLRSPRLCQLDSLPSSLFGWLPALHSPPGSLNTTSNVSLTSGWIFPSDYSGCRQTTCLHLGATKQKTLELIQAMNDCNWIHKSLLQVEMTQYHKDVHLYVSTIVHLDLSPYDNRAIKMSILPFHLEDPGQGVNLAMVLAVSLLLAAMGFLYPELSAMLALCTSDSSYSPHWTRLLLGLASAATGLVHIGRIWLTKCRMERFRTKTSDFISLHDVALLSRAQVALSATLLLLIMIKITQQLRFMRRWAIFTRTFQLLGKELPKLLLVLAALLLALTVVTSALFPALSVSCSTSILPSLWSSGSLRSMLGCVPRLGWVALSVWLVCRGLLCGSVLSTYRRIRAENYCLVLEPQDHEMIDFFVKRFKLWLGVKKPKEYRHSVKFKGLDQRSAKPSAALVQPKITLPQRPPSSEPEDRASPSSPHPVLSPALAVDHLPGAITDLLDRMDKVTLVLEEVNVLEQRLKCWQIMQKAAKMAQQEMPPSSLEKQLVLPRTQNTFSESALTQLKSTIVMSNTYMFSRWGAPMRACLPRQSGSADMCSRPRVVTARRPHSEESLGGRKQSTVLTRPFPLKRKAWDSEKPDVRLSKCNW
ncbi:polycystin-1-like [Hyperolius riggenbachi]|uniref:polycystin-1-like n=1 Tax=Hyperolius riggenbachi TaxID=752182 RepID=UPI0035A2CE04